MLPNHRFRVTTVVLFVLVGLIGLVLQAALPSQPASAHELSTPADLELLRKAQTSGPVRVVIRLNVPTQLEANLTVPGVQAQRVAIQAARAALLARLAAYQPQVTSTDWIVPFMALRIDAAGLQALLNDPQVLSVREDFQMQGGLTESLPLVGAPTAWARGFDGSGYSVAVLDTGVDLTHPFIKDKIIGEACFSTSGGTEYSLCPNGLDSQIGTGASASCTGGYGGTDCSHGTHVSGIAAGGMTDRSGVARGAKLVTLQVFTGNSACSPNPCNYVYWSDTIDGLNWVYTMRATYNVAAINMSLGNSISYPAICDSPGDAQQAIIEQLRAAGVATTVSAMNNGYTNGLAYPACLSQVVSVGSTEKTDVVASYSNSANYLSILAPGSAITSSVIGGSYQAWYGTSMAAPHVAGAFAILKQARPTATITELLSLLQDTGKPITDARNGITKRRIQIDRALPLQPVAGIERVSVASDGTQGNSISVASSLSGNGRFVVFGSGASNLVSDDTNANNDVFVHDRQTNVTTRVSVASGGVQSIGGSSLNAAISADGRFVAFDSGATNLVSGDTNNWTDIFVHDRQTSQTTRVSLTSAGAQASAASRYPAISADGRFVAFDSFASDLVGGDTNGYLDVFVHDRQTGQTTRVSVASDGSQGDSASARPDISADGRYVAYYSYASNLVTGDTNSVQDIFVHDRQTGQTTRVSVASGGAQADGASESPVFSADGRYVAFYSTATNLVSGDTNSKQDVFVHDRQTGQTTRVSVASGGAQATDSSEAPAISADGRYVAFSSWASNLVSGDTNSYQDVFVHDRQTGITRRVSNSPDGTQANHSSLDPTLSADGGQVVFTSYASNLIVGDTNAYRDIFVTPTGNRPDTVGIFRPSNTTFYLRNSNTTGPADLSVLFGTSTDQSVAGDWDGDGVDTIGVYRNGMFYLKNANSTAAPLTYQFTLGNPGDLPMSGDWDGDGKDGVGTFRPTNGRLYLKNSLSTGFADFAMVLGISGDRPVAGDWNGDSFDSPGVYRPSNSQFYLTNQRCNCIVIADYQLTLGNVGDVGFAGDWDGNGFDGVGVFRPTNGVTYLKNLLTTGFADINMIYGIANDRPIAGRWVSSTNTYAPMLAPEFKPGR